MSEGGGVRARILAATVALVRRHGPAKTGVVDVARALGMSHANVYRHFPSKQALFEAVARDWLEAVSEPLAAIAADPAIPPPERLARWLLSLRAAKLEKVRADPELFATYHGLVEASGAVVGEHVGHLLQQLAQIIADGQARGDFAGSDPAAAARATLNATLALHHPDFVRREPPMAESEAQEVVALVVAGLAAR